MKLSIRQNIYKVIETIVVVFLLVCFLLNGYAIVNSTWNTVVVLSSRAALIVLLYCLLIDSPVYNSAMIKLIEVEPKSFNEAEELVQEEMEIDILETRNAIRRYFRGK